MRQWWDKYRPEKLDGYVFKDISQKRQILKWVENGTINHTILFGPSGTGKTTLAMLILNELGVDPGDILYINASVNNGIDYIREKVVGFSDTMSYGGMKYIILDECDYITPGGFAALRGIMQDDIDTTRFIMTCNYIHRVPDNIISRCDSMVIDSLDRVEFTTRVAEILISENIEVDYDTLTLYVNKTYPDMRMCLNSVQANSYNGILEEPPANLVNVNDKFVELVSLFQERRLKDARKFLAENIPVEQYEEVYRFMYDNVEMFADTEELQFEAILIIKEGLVDHACVGDPEICLSATLIQLSMVTKNG
jgi:DNA polymerase III delta prime subunit